MTELASETIHASAVAIGDRAVLIEGPSGSGKSDLALRLIDRGAVLISDDYTLVRRQDGRLTAWAPGSIAGRIEIRGLGIRRMDHRDGVEVALVVRAAETPPRLPSEREWRRVSGGKLPVMLLSLLEASAPIKVEHALAALNDAPEAG